MNTSQEPKWSIISEPIVSLQYEHSTIEIAGEFPETNTAAISVSKKKTKNSYSQLEYA